MLFGKRKRIVKRILIVEDEPLTAFDNENMLGDAGYEVVATIDNFDEAIALLDARKIDLILSDVHLQALQALLDSILKKDPDVERRCPMHVWAIR